MDDIFLKELESISDDTLAKIYASTFSLYSQVSVASKDSDETSFISSVNREDVDSTRQSIQNECWKKFNENPQVNTAVRGLVGRIVGSGYEVSSPIPAIQQVVTEIETDYRNRLYNYWPKMIGRNFVEGELHICFTVHEDGFVEVDFIDPATVTGNDNVDGIIFHPYKTFMPLVYIIQTKDSTDYVNGKDTHIQIPSIYVARNPSLLKFAKEHRDFNEEELKFSRNSGSVFKSVGGFNRFIVSWDRSFMTQRSTSYLRTVIKWLNHYEHLKKYEIDHKKAAGSFLWVAEFSDWKTYRMFLALSDKEKQETGLGAKLTPGGRLLLPPGVTFKAVNPTLPNISDSDTDILHMVTAGLNEPEDVSTGQSKGTFASVKASRGPMSDRVSDEISYYDKFVKYDFWGSIFFLKSQVSGFPERFTVEEVVDFKDQEPVTKTVSKKPEDLIEISYPTSETVDLEGRARTWLGVKHGSTNDTLGISNATIARKLGIHNYYKERLRAETEKIRFPELIPTMDAESFQESTEAEPSSVVRRRKPNQQQPAKKGKANGKENSSNGSR